RLLVGEDPEDRALGDAGRLGDVPGGHRQAMLEQQGEGGLDDGGAALGRGQGRGTPSPARRALAFALALALGFALPGDHRPDSTLSESTLIRGTPETGAVG